MMRRTGGTDDDEDDDDDDDDICRCIYLSTASHHVTAIHHSTVGLR